MVVSFFSVLFGLLDVWSQGFEYEQLLATLFRSKFRKISFCCHALYFESNFEKRRVREEYGGVARALKRAKRSLVVVVVVNLGEGSRMALIVG